MDNVHWDKYYTKNSKPFSPSDFALSMIKNLKVNSTLIDIGCGNGRDSLFFSQRKIKTVGIDQSKIAIENLKSFENKYLNFENLNILDLNNKNFDYGYCRFLFHSINEKEENFLLSWLKKNINNKIFIESRVIEKEKNIIEGDHYRRLMDLELFKSKLEDLNLKVLSIETSSKFSVYKDSYNVSDLQTSPLLARFIIEV